MEGTFSDGAFTFHQTTDDSLVELRLEAAGTEASSSLAQASAKKKKKKAKRKSARAKKRPRVWGTARGKFRTKGRHGAATVRGTRWLTAERANGTFFRVTEGEILAESFVTGEQRLLRAGESWLAPRECPGKDRFWIRLGIPRRAVVERVRVTVRGKRARVRRVEGNRALIQLRDGPARHVSAKLRIRLADGRIVTGIRAYDTCSSMPGASAKP
jgi:hypothetical protein